MFLVQSCSSQASEAAAAHSRSVIARIGLVFRVYCVAAVVLLMLHQQQPYALATGGHSIDTQGCCSLFCCFKFGSPQKFVCCKAQLFSLLSFPFFFRDRPLVLHGLSVVAAAAAAASLFPVSQSHSALHSLVSHSNSRQAMSCSHFTSLAKCSAQCFPVDSVRGGYLGLGGWMDGRRDTRAHRISRVAFLTQKQKKSCLVPWLCPPSTTAVAATVPTALHAFNYIPSVCGILAC